MPQPVPPPEPPSIVSTSQPGEFAPLAASTPTLFSVSTRTMQTGAVAAPTPPETLPPESSSSISIPKRSAVLLGSPISVGHSVVGAKQLPAKNANSENKTQPVKERATAPVLQKSLSVSQLPSVEQQPKEPPPEPNPTQSEDDRLSPLPPSEGTGRESEDRLPLELPPETPRESDTPVSPSRLEGEPWSEEELVPVSPPRKTQAQQPSPVTPTTGSNGSVVELTSDRQEYEVDRQVVTAEGDVLLRYQGSVVDADRVQLNLPNRIVVGEGNIALKRGAQTIRGDRLEYFFAQDSGFVLNASGEIYQPTAGTDFSGPLPNDTRAFARPLSDRILANQPLSNISNPGGFGAVFGAGRTIQNQSAFQQGGTLNRLRFQADRIDFDSEGAIAKNVRFTNDPFSPPELEVRADTARFRRISPLVDEITSTNSRLVFDQGFSIPIFQDRRVIDRREREPGIVTFGYDDGERGGVFAERTFQLISTDKVLFRITPQYFIQKAITEGDYIDPSVFGVRSRLDVTLSPTTTLRGTAVFTSLDPEEIAEDRLRASLRLRQTIGTRYPHTLNLEYSYRDRLFNGSLGFQTVQSSIGAVLTSPVIPLGNTGINLNYQAGAQIINADTDRIDLLDPVRTNNRVTLNRYEGSATLSRAFTLWRGEALPATPTEGLRYTPVPIVPYLQLTTSATGVYSGYSNGDTQESLSANIGLQGQIGHFSKPFLDYTGFNVSLSQVARNGTSPFLFDRLVDTKVLYAGLTQQIYGPFRAGFQTAISLDTGDSISTDYFLEYSRRTYNVILRYNPVLELGSISLRINDFNWLGNPDPFPGSGVRPVIQGVPATD
ncbi:DUF3769 domain-containing protein [Cyanobacteria bacterium FACHB-472]|nr:DUF3769 domain-containing protein [Cyanobacteria bacterium FACHB-472]